RARVVIPYAHELEASHLPLLFEARELREKPLDAVEIAVLQVPSPIVRVDVPLERRYTSLAWVVWRGAGLHPLSIASVGYVRALAGIPNVARTRGSDGRLAFIVVGLAPLGVLGGPGLFHVVRGVSAHGPVMAVGAHLGFGIEVVQQDKLPCEGVVIRGDLFPEKREAGIAVPFRHVAKHLVVRAILFDHIDDVTDRRFLSHAPRDRGLPGKFHGQTRLLGVRYVP